MTDEYSCGCRGQVKSCGCEGCGMRLKRIGELEQALRRIEDRLLVDIERDIRVAMVGHGDTDDTLQR